MDEATSLTPLDTKRYNAAKQRITHFQRFGEAHLHLAYHAAFPMALTPDLLYRIRANFQRDINKKPLNIPWIAVADLLLSNLCEEVEHELYEMNADVRVVLLNDLKNDPNFGQKRIKELAILLYDYVEQQMNNEAPALVQAQRWTALPYINPIKAAHELASALHLKLQQNNRGETLRMVSLIETFADPLKKLLPEYTPLLMYAQDIAHFVRGDVKSVATQPDNETKQVHSRQVFGVTLPALGQVHQEIERTQEQIWSLTKSLYELLSYCTVKILAPLTQGTGFFVAPGLVLTCATVVKDFQVSDESIKVSWNGQLVTALLHSFNANSDLALLRVGISSHPCVLLHGGVRPFGNLYSYGYTDAQPQGTSVTLEIEGWLGGGQELLRLRQEPIRPGMMGAPLLNMETGGVCGIFRSTHLGQTELYNEAMSTKVIFREFPAIESAQKQYHQQDKIWENLLTLQQRRALELDIPLDVFIIYADEDRDMLTGLEEHLSFLVAQRLITIWHRGKILPGRDVQQEINKHLETASIIFLLVSIDFLSSEECYRFAQQAVERYQREKALVIPILLRSVSWQDSAFGMLAPLPTNGSPISLWLNHDAAYADIVQDISTVVEQLRTEQPKFKEYDVFLCYNRRDRSAVEKIAIELDDRGVMPWFDEWALIPGQLWRPALEEQIRQSKSIAIFIGQEGVSPWQYEELEVLIRDFIGREGLVIPVILPDAPHRPKLPLFLEGISEVDFRVKSPDPIERLIWGITGKRPDFDICVFCALEEEARAFLTVTTEQCNVQFEDGFSSESNSAYRFATIRNNKGEPLKIHVSWLPNYGPTEVTLRLTSVLKEFKPRFVAMTGICTGDRRKVRLGDLVVADRAFTYDSGKFVLGEDGQQEHLHDTAVLGPDQRVLQIVRMFDAWEPAVAALLRPPSKRQQREWLLNTLLTEATPHVDDIPYTELKKHAPLWREIVAELQAGPHPYLTTERTLRDPAGVRNLRYGRDEFPFTDPPHATRHIAPMASGSAVRSDDPFREVQVPVRGTVAIDMEGAAFYRTVANFAGMRSLLVKGVSDYTDSDKDDTYHHYASAASAIYVLSFIKEYVTQERMPR